AWARRLAKRFGAEGRIDDRTSVLEGTGDPAIVLDFDCVEADSIDPDIQGFFATLDRNRGDAVVAFGWAMAETLAALAH
ncbi:MAG: hypothetical protein M3256_04750, partial [Actinomycetota bacterium]|nr:hypothetical protein [Actinomycetota bacterium]